MQALESINNGPKNKLDQKAALASMVRQPKTAFMNMCVILDLQVNKARSCGDPAETRGTKA
jgi:hypothetical protein